MVQAGRNIRQDDVASVVSLGAIVRGDARPGASIAVLAPGRASPRTMAPRRVRYTHLTRQKKA
ncbi:hypothetical protein HGQ98_34505 [Achromobacter ruhlandii]|uniref:Uncharacterized protein n=1 Tax=Achromobacter ruhlandii TaxID=72557 RepID=A0A848NSH8_9BURK|nr:hypothetical protein [Achromobacter ruhlandii]NMU94137.1 hypothetical protein [Achromobacter ruhlandii]